MLSEKLVSIERYLIGQIWQDTTIQENMRYMADELGSRFAGTESEKRGQEYMVQKFKEYGYVNAHSEEFTYFGWTRGPVLLEMLEPKRREFPAISLALSPGGDVEGNLVFLGTGSPEEFEAVNREAIEGKIVLCTSGTSPSGKRVHRRTKYGYAVDRGAIGFIFMNHNPGQLLPTGSLRPAYKMAGEVPGIGVSLEIGTLLLRLGQDQPIKIRISDTSRVIPNSISRNIIAELHSSTSKDEWIIVGGHYDGHDIAQGAMDNLSGIAVIMELAKVYRKYENAFRRNIRFICFGCEELGVTGSTQYTEKHRNELHKVAIMINLELGRLADKAGTQHTAFTVHQPSEFQRQLKQFSKEIQYPMSVTTQIVTASDHWPFYLQGVPTISMHAEPSPRLQIVGRGWGHTTADTMDKVDFRNLQEGAMVLARLLLRLANMEANIAAHTPIHDVRQSLIKTGMKEILEIEKKWDTMV